MADVEDKGPGRGKGRFAGRGHEADQEARLSALEDYIADLIDSGQLPATEVEGDVEEPEA